MGRGRGAAVLQGKWDELTPQLRAAAYALGYTTSVCWDWEVGQTLWYEGIEEEAAAQPEADPLGGPPDDGPPPWPRYTTKREDGQMRRIDEPPPELEPVAAAPAKGNPPAAKAAGLFDAAVAKEKAAAAAAAGPSKATGLRDFRLAESSSSVPTLDEAVALLLKNGPAQFYDVHETLNKILDNVTANPGDDKYRRLKRSNPVLNMKVFSATGSERFLQCVGFVEQRDDKDGTVLVLRAEGVKGTLSHFQKTRLAAGKDALKTAKASKPAFPPL